MDDPETKCSYTTPPLERATPSVTLAALGLGCTSSPEIEGSRYEGDLWRFGALLSG